MTEKSVNQALLGALPIGLPPIQYDDPDLLQDFLTNTTALNLHSDLSTCQKYIARVPRYESIYHVDVTPLQTDVVVSRDHVTGGRLGVVEHLIENTDKSAKNSTSLLRLPGDIQDGVKGSSTNFPFWPGGLEEPNLSELKSAVGSVIDFDNDLLTVAPGLGEGVVFERSSAKNTSVVPAPLVTSGVINIADILGHGNDIDLGADLKDASISVENKKTISTTQISEAEAEELLKDDGKSVSGGQMAAAATKIMAPVEKWAELLDTQTPVKDFHQRVPDMALTYPFELDTFQKQAILKLESRQCVFVAAHTSAGKTVVAEYAIALSLRHMTKAVYTSPIKALSNQKFRDFKDKFEDVGLVTGDVQIRSEASCLVMTTEILRSMLYSGSDVIRDLEWVIFDEVHYINDLERGVVWEEVLIMLPQHVNIVMLSATVSNSLEFAEWVGRTKKKKIYVSSTLYRPVPLEHFLYTGNSTKTSNELFLLLDSKKNFSSIAYQKAVDAKKERQSKHSQTSGPKGPRYNSNPQQDKNIWLSLIQMLEKKDNLPAVAFIFSRKRIEDTASMLTNIDLTTASDKSHIHVFYKKSIDKLKPPDRKLPQILRMGELLKRGIGLHHSGILPILKEVVEMLFQRGMVKILFATETFAMGVNMPARTVVFDSLRKHDGKELRDLNPGEYIQMAGRAGRRGLDTTGTVIILCKADPPEFSELHKIMMGKPAKLESQFRVTYSMILNLMRVESLRVEEMMRRSFREFHAQTDLPQQRDRLKEKLTRLEELRNGSVAGFDPWNSELREYYDSCEEYWSLRNMIKDKILSQNHQLKVLAPGRVVVLDRLNGHSTVLAVILQAPSASTKDKLFRVLVTGEENKPVASSVGKSAGVSAEPIVTVRPVRPGLLYRPEGRPGHEIVSVDVELISQITTKTLKINSDKIMDDHNRRQASVRFRSDPPDKNTVLAAQELLRLIESNPTSLPSVDPIRDLRMQDMDIVQDAQRLRYLEESLPQSTCLQTVDFDEKFEKLRTVRDLEADCNSIQHMLSDEGLAMLPEYQNKVKVLKDLGYLDGRNNVQLKGRIACECGNNELLITELVFNNILSPLQPTEIAALLSTLVFDQKRCPDPKLSKELQACKKSFLEVAERLAGKQAEYRLDEAQEFVFGLMEIVFEWTRGMTFSRIMELTEEIQEGIIVRCIQRLYELLRDVRNAAKIIGDPVLTSKMEEAMAMIKRDIVFSASLYIQ